MNRLSVRDEQVTIEYRGRTAVMTEAEIDMNITMGKSLEAEMARKLGRSLDVPFAIHKNRDGSLAAAIGKIVPLLKSGKAKWPEDERVEREEIRRLRNLAPKVFPRG